MIPWGVLLRAAAGVGLGVVALFDASYGDWVRASIAGSGSLLLVLNAGIRFGRDWS